MPKKKNASKRSDEEKVEGEGGVEYRSHEKSMLKFRDRNY